MSERSDKETCLFSEANVRRIMEDYDEWFHQRLREEDRQLDGKYFTTSGIPVKLIYTPADIQGIRYSEDIGFSGQPPYVRGVRIKLM